MNVTPRPQHAHLRRGVPRGVRRLRVAWRRLRRGGERGSTMLEWVLLLAVVAFPSYFIIQLGLQALFGHYRLITTVNGLPFP